MKKNNKKELEKKCNQFSKNLFRAVEQTSDYLNENTDLQKYILWMFFNESIFNKTTSPFLDQHLRGNYTEIEKEYFLGFYLTTMNKKRLLEAVEEFITGSGGAKFKKVLNNINQSLKKEQFVC